MSDFLTADAMTAILAHMNDDHASDSLEIVRAFGPADATSAVMTGLDEDHAFFEATTPVGTVQVSIPWPERLVDRASVRHQVVALHQAATGRTSQH